MMEFVQDYFLALIMQTRQAGRYGTSNLYAGAMKSFFRFVGNRSLTFMELTPTLIKQYEEYLMAEGRQRNTTSTYMRMLRSIFRQAAKSGKTFNYDIETLFANIFTGYQPTRKRAIPPSLIRRLADIDLTGKPMLRFSRDMFLLSFYLQGIPYIDLANLRKTDIKQQTLYYCRHKTLQQLSVRIEPCAAKIIQRYQRENDASSYLLPIITQTGEAGYKQYRNALRLYNQHLHTLSTMLHLRTPLTSYVARHSWATTAKNQHIPTSVISECLGHSSERVTHVYLASFDFHTLSSANKKVIAAVHATK